jgi:methionyl-tRNA synthetase
VHDDLTVEGRKMSKSLGTAIDPHDAVERYGTAALRWWFARDVPPNGDVDVLEALLAARANELADGLGNLVNRTIALVDRNRRLAADAAGCEQAAELALDRARLPAAIDDALGALGLRSATAALSELVARANGFVAATRPWELAGAARAGDGAAGERLDAVLAALLDACGVIARELQPSVPPRRRRTDRAGDRRPRRAAGAIAGSRVRSGRRARGGSRLGSDREDRPCQAGVGSRAASGS